MRRSLALLALLVVPPLAAACIDKDSAQKAIQSIQEASGPVPDVLPVMLNREAPFHYPPGLYSKKVQGNVTLRIRIDSTGAVVPESTTVAETSGYATLDSAASAGASALRFKPARLHGAPVAVSILLPVFFRHPGSAPLPGDTILHRRTDTARTP